MTEVRPFPWSALRRVRRSGARDLSRTRTRLHQAIDLPSLLTALEALLDARMECALDESPPLPEAIRASAGCTLAIRVNETEILLSLEAALAKELVLRALKRPSAPLVLTERHGSPELAAAAGAVLFAAIRRAKIELPFTLLHAGVAASDAEWRLWATESFSARSSLASKPTTDLFAIRLKIILGDSAYFAHAYMDSTPVPSPTRFDETALRSLGTLRLSLSVVLGTFAISDEESLALGMGDALAPLRYRANEDTDVLLSSPGSSHGKRACLRPDGSIVIKEGMASITTEETEILGAAPVLVRVEIGTVELRAIDWANVAPGDVLGTTKKLGDPVILRIGASEFARGELVDLDGEVGVRILSKA